MIKESLLLGRRGAIWKKLLIALWVLVFGLAPVAAFAADFVVVGGTGGKDNFDQNDVVTINTFPGSGDTAEVQFLKWEITEGEEDVDLGIEDPESRETEVTLLTTNAEAYVVTSIWEYLIDVSEYGHVSYDVQVSKTGGFITSGDIVTISADQFIPAQSARFRTWEFTAGKDILSNDFKEGESGDQRIPVVGNGVVRMAPLYAYLFDVVSGEANPEFEYVRSGEVFEVRADDPAPPDMGFRYWEVPNNVSIDVATDGTTKVSLTNNSTAKIEAVFGHFVEIDLGRGDVVTKYMLLDDEPVGIVASPDLSTNRFEKWLVTTIATSGDNVEILDEWAEETEVELTSAGPAKIKATFVDTFPVTIIGSTYDGPERAASGDRVEFRADLPNEAVALKEWAVADNYGGLVTVTLETVNDPAFFTMVSDEVRVTGIYNYPLDVGERGNANKSLITSGDSFMVSADLALSNDERFREWKVTSGELALSNWNSATSTDQTVEVTNNVAVTMEPFYEYRVKVHRDQFGVLSHDVWARTGDAPFDLVASEDVGRKFAEWRATPADAINFTEFTAQVTTFDMDKNVPATIEAHFTSATASRININGGEIVSIGGQLPELPYAEDGDVVVIKADDLEFEDDEYRLIGWKVLEGGVEVSNNTFIMSSIDVSIEPVFEFSVKLDDGQLGFYEVGDVVSLDVSNKLVPNRVRFAEWEVTKPEENPPTISPAAAAVASFTMIAGPVEVESVLEYSINVVSGDSVPQGFAKEEQEVTITADTVPGMEFAGWTVEEGDVELDSAIANPAKFDMPAEPVAITAHFAPSGTRRITMNDGSVVSINDIPFTEPFAYAKSGDVVTIAPFDKGVGSRFVEWNVENDLVDIVDNKFTMLEDALEITAVFEYSVEVAYGFSSVTDGYAIPGATVVISPDVRTDGRFEIWTTTDVVLVPNDSANPATFEMPAKPVEIAASVSYPVEVDGGWAETGVPDMPATRAVAGSTVTIIAEDKSDDGLRFVSWVVVSGGVTLANYTNEQTTFTMGQLAVEIEAEFIEEDLFRVVIEGGKADATGGGNFSEGARVDIFAGTPVGALEVFVRWVNFEGVTFDDEYLARTFFRMPPRDVSVFAYFEDANYFEDETDKFGDLPDNLAVRADPGVVIEGNVITEGGKLLLVSGEGSGMTILLEVIVPTGTQIAADGTMSLPAGESFVVITPGNNTQIIVEGEISFQEYEFVIGDETFAADGIIVSGDIMPQGGLTTITLSEGLIFEEDNEFWEEDAEVRSFSAGGKVMFILVTAEEGATIESTQTNPELPKWVPVGTLLKVDPDGKVTIAYQPDEEKKKSSGCTTGTGSLLALLALAGMSFVSKRRR